MWTDGSEPDTVPPMRYAVLACLSLLAIGCPTGPSGAPAADVTPLSLDFGAVEVGAWQILEVSIANVGTSQLNVEAATVTDDGAYTSGGAEMQLRPNESGTISVSFQPSEPGTFANTLVFATNAPRDPLFEIPLNGTAVAPALSASAESIDFGTRADGCITSSVITLTNSGDAALVGLDVRVTGADEGVSIDVSEPVDLEPGATQDITVSWEPTDAEAVDAQLEVSQGNETLLSVGIEGVATALTTSESDVFSVPEVSEVDFLWVIDTGLTMDVVQPRIGNGSFDLMDELEDQFYDWRFAVVSADADGGGELLAPVIEPSTADRVQTFGAAVSQSGGSVMPGWGLEMAWAALNSPNTDSGGPNEGILRPGAGLAIVFVSTGVDQSAMLGGSGEAFRDAFIALKADPAMVSISVITGGEQGCSGANVAASQTPEYIAAAWRGQVQSVCTNPQPLWPLTYSGPHSKSAFPLDPPALNASIEVTITPDGGEPAVDTSWSYDADNDWLVFPDGSLPPADSEVSVQWARADVCED